MGTPQDKAFEEWLNGVGQPREAADDPYADYDLRGVFGATTGKPSPGVAPQLSPDDPRVQPFIRPLSAARFSEPDPETGMVRDRVAGAELPAADPAAKAYMDRIAAVRDMARAASKNDRYSWSESYRRQTLDPAVEKLLEGDHSTIKPEQLPDYETQTMRVREAIDNPRKIVGDDLPDDLAADDMGSITDLYYTSLENRGAFGRAALTPERWAKRLLELNADTLADDEKRLIQNWTARMGAYHAKKPSSRLPSQLLDLYEEREAVERIEKEKPGSPEAAARGRRLSALENDWIREQNDEATPDWQHGAMHAKAGMEGFIGGVVPGGDELLKAAMDKLGVGADGQSYSELTKSLTDIMPEGRYETAYGLGKGTGMLYSPLTRGTGALTGAGKGLLGRMGATGSQFAVTGVADTIFDEVVGKWSGGKFEDYDERMEKAADEFVARSGLHKPEEQGQLRDEFMRLAHKGFGERLVKDTAGTFMTGAAFGALRPLKEAMLAGVTQRLAKSSAARVGIVQKIAEGSFDNMLLSALPNYSSMGLSPSVVSQLADPATREDAVGGFIANWIQNIFLTPGRVNAEVAGRQARNALQKSGRLGMKDSTATWDALRPIERQQLVEATLQQLKKNPAYGDVINGVADALEQVSKMKQNVDAKKPAEPTPEPTDLPDGTPDYDSIARPAPKATKTDARGAFSRWAVTEVDGAEVTVGVVGPVGDGDVAVMTEDGQRRIVPASKLQDVASDMGRGPSDDVLQARIIAENPAEFGMTPEQAQRNLEAVEREEADRGEADRAMGLGSDDIDTRLEGAFWSGVGEKPEGDYAGPRRGAPDMGVLSPLESPRGPGVESPPPVEPTPDTPSRSTVNVGLKVGDGTGTNKTPEDVVKAFADVGVKVSEHEIHKSDTEDTFVAELDAPLTPEQARKVADALDQDAISVHDGKAGSVHGRKAEAWGAFDPAKFILKGGKRMKAAAAPEATKAPPAAKAAKKKVKAADEPQVESFGRKVGKSQADFEAKLVDALGKTKKRMTPAQKAAAVFVAEMRAKTLASARGEDVAQTFARLGLSHGIAGIREVAKSGQRLIGKKDYLDPTTGRRRPILLQLSGLYDRLTGMFEGDVSPIYRILASAHLGRLSRKDAAVALRDVLPDFKKKVDVVGRDTAAVLVEEAVTAKKYTENSLAAAAGLPDGTRGLFQFFEDGKSLVHLAESADFSTVAHEMTHFLEHYLPEGSEMLKVIKNYLEIPQDQDLDHDAKEVVADLYEVYITSGRAPTPELKDVFKAFEAFSDNAATAIKRLRDAQFNEPAADAAMDAETKAAGLSRLPQVPESQADVAAEAKAKVTEAAKATTKKAKRAVAEGRPVPDEKPSSSTRVKLSDPDDVAAGMRIDLDLDGSSLVDVYVTKVTDSTIELEGGIKIKKSQWSQRAKGAEATFVPPEGMQRQVEHLISDAPDLRVRTKKGGVDEDKTLERIVKFLHATARQNKVFGRRNLDNVPDEEIVRQLYEHGSRELDAWTKARGSDYVSFYVDDIQKKANPALDAWAREELGRPLSTSETVLFHILGSLSSAQATPGYDSQMAGRIFTRWLLRGGDLKDLHGFQEGKEAVAYKQVIDEGGKKKRIPIVDEETGEPVLARDEEGNTRAPKVSPTFGQGGLDRIKGLVEKVGLDEAVRWMTSHHTWDEVAAIRGSEPEASEYLSKEDGGFGIFAFLGAKQGAYAMNRISDLSFVTKDMWVARQMARYQSNLKDKKGLLVKTPWKPSTIGGRRLRGLLDVAWRKIGEERGLTPAEVQERFWDMEKTLWARMGYMEDASTISSGVEKAVSEAREIRRAAAEAAGVRVVSEKTQKGEAKTPEEAARLLLQAGSEDPELRELALDEIAADALRGVVHPEEHSEPYIIETTDAELREAKKAMGAIDTLRRAGGGEVLVTPGGLYEVVRDGDAVRLEPTNDMTGLSVGRDTKIVGGIETDGGVADALRSFDASFGDAISNVVSKVTSPILDFLVNGVFFNKKTPITAAMRRKLTDLDMDPAVRSIQERSQGRRLEFLESVVKPLQAMAEEAGLGKGMNPAQNEEFARALDAGEDLPGEAGAKLTAATRAAFNNLLDKMVEVGLWDRGHAARFRDKYFPYMDWGGNETRRLKKSIARLEKLKKERELTEKETRWLRAARRRLDKVQASVAKPDDLVKMTGQVKTQLLDASDVLSNAARMRMRTSESLDDAIENGLDISTDPVGAVLRALHTEFRAVEAVRTFNEVAEHAAKSKVPGTELPMLIDPENPPEGVDFSDGKTPDGYVFVPAFSAKDGEAAVAFGNLSGKYLHKTIWARFEGEFERRGATGKIYDLVHAAVKRGKTMFRPAGHVLQWVGNPLIWAAHGVPAVSFRRIYSEGHNVVEGVGKVPLVEVRGRVVPADREFMMREGILTGDANVELEGATKRNVAELAIDSDERLVGFFEGLIEFGEKLIPFSKSAQELYGKADGYSRAGLYLEFRRNGETHEQAQRHVNDIYDMSNVPTGVQHLARHVSFFRFQYSILRNAKTIMARTPWAMGKALSLFWLLQKAHAATLGVDDEEYDEQLWAAFPGSDFGQMFKRMTAAPYLPATDDGRPGWWSVWSMFPQQTMLQGFMPTPAEERGGGKLQAALLNLIGGQSVVTKPIAEAALDMDLWSGQRQLRRFKYGASGEGGFPEWVASGAKHVAKGWSPDILARVGDVAEATGLSPLPRQVSMPDASGRFKTLADAGSEMLGIRPSRPDAVKADIVRKGEEVFGNEAVFMDPEGRPRVRSGVGDREKAKANKQIQARDASIKSAGAYRALAWLRDGDEDRAVREIRSVERLNELAAELHRIGDGEAAKALRALTRSSGIIGKLSR